MMKYERATLKQQKPFKDKFGTSFRAGHAIYKIVWCKELFNDERACYGVCNPEMKEIYIDITQSDIQETLIHEMFHAEVYESGMKQMSSFYHDLEELCCEAASRVCKNFELKRKNAKSKRR